MNKVISINLNGNAYQIDETGYDKLKAYMTSAEAKLAGNPDRAEIIADFEQAIADKCLKYISAQKTVVSATEIDQIILQMGPVQGAGEESVKTTAAPTADTATAAAPRRLYQIQDGAWISGVCNGLAAYFGIDVRFVRAFFFVFTIVTQGAGILLYIALMLFVPYATTSEQAAEAHGLPFNAQELLDRATLNYQTFRNSKDWRNWKRGFRRQSAAMRYQFRQQSHHWRNQWSRNMHGWGTPAGVAPMPPAAALIARPFFGLIHVALFAFFALAVYSLGTTGAVFGWVLNVNAPLWMEIVGVALVYKVVASPFKAAHHGLGYGFSLWSVWGGLLETALMIAIGYWAYLNVPQFHEFVNHLPQLVQAIVDKFSNM